MVHFVFEDRELRQSPTLRNHCDKVWSHSTPAVHDNHIINMERLDVTTVVCIVLCMTYLHSTTAIVVRNCEGNTLTISCSRGERIRINSANYGRTADGSVCYHPSIQTTHCIGANSFSIVNGRCGGETSCSIQASNEVFGDPCVMTAKYLEVDYQCEPAEPLDLVEPVTACDTVLRCEGGTVNLQCPLTSPAIYICDAMYGRQAPGSMFCPHQSIQTTHCTSGSALSIVRSACQGKSSCSVAASNSVFTDPCVNTYKYLEVKYACGKLSRACEGGNLRLACPHLGQAIRILDGYYGRKAGPEICPHPSINTQNCAAESSMSVLRTLCDGKNACFVPANNGAFNGDPCINTYKYLEVIYECFDINN